MAEFTLPPSPPEPVAPKHPAAGLLRFLLELLETILLAAVLFFGINAATARIRVQSISMQPTLYDEDFVVVNKLAYKLGSPNRGDVVIFMPPLASEKIPYIKRLIGLPGDTIRVSTGSVYVNGTLLEENYVKAPPNYAGNWVVPQGTIFVLGDNRNNSSDSHFWGVVPLQNVIGKAEFVYFPISHWKSLVPSSASAAGN
jgi:signal peptidase I